MIIDKTGLDHGKNLSGLWNRSKVEQGKANLGMKQIIISHLITGVSLKSNLSKGKIMMKMLIPTDGTGVQEFLGFVNYLSLVLPHLPVSCDPLKGLTEKDVEWLWFVNTE